MAEQTLQRRFLGNTESTISSDCRLSDQRQFSFLPTAASQVLIFQQEGAGPEFGKNIAKETMIFLHHIILLSCHSWRVLTKDFKQGHLKKKQREVSIDFPDSEFVKLFDLFSKDSADHARLLLPPPLTPGEELPWKNQHTTHDRWEVCSRPPRTGVVRRD